MAGPLLIQWQHIPHPLGAVSAGHEAAQWWFSRGRPGGVRGWQKTVEERRRMEELSGQGAPAS